MHRLTLPATLLLCLTCRTAVSQEEAKVPKIGVALLHIHNDDNQAVQARDALVKVLNQHKPDKTLNVVMQAFGLDSLPGKRAMDEARSHGYEFVLYVRVQALQKSRDSVTNSSGVCQNLEADTALLEYELRRVADSANLALGTARSRESDSGQDAILDAIVRIPNKVAADLKNVDAEDARVKNASPAATISSSETIQVEPSSLSGEQVGENSCAWLPKNIPHSEALLGVCEYSASEREKIPNFVCREETSRYLGHHRVPADLVTATIRYVDGEESYTDLKRNGRPVPGAMWNTAGMWSSGQFHGNLRAIFTFGNQAVFAFDREDKIGTRSVLVFTYHISKQNEPLWELRAEDQLAAPPFQGELWVDTQTGNVLRFRTAAGELPAKFPLRSAEILTDYDNIAFPDGTRFLLPVKAEISTRYRDADLIRNVVEFRGCHKFRATARMITEAADAGGISQLSAGERSAELALEIEENEKIYTILREEAITEDAARLELEQQQNLRSATGAAFFRLAQLSKQREQLLAANPKNLRPVSASELVTNADGTTTFRVNVKLVPVSIVVRDSKGRALGKFNKQDFQLFDNRKPQEITTFLVQGSATNDSDSGSSEAGVKPVTPNHVAYVFDDLHTVPSDLAKAKAAAERHLSRLQTGDRVALFTTSGDVVQDFTADPDKLRTALRKVKSHASATPADCPPMSYFTADLIVQGDQNATELALQDAGDCLFPDSGTVNPAIRGAQMQQANERQKAATTVRAKAGEVVSMGKMESDRTLGILFDAFNRTLRVSGKRTIVLLSPGFLTLVRNQQQGVMYLIERALQSEVVISSIDVRGLAGTGQARLGTSQMNSPPEISTLESQGDTAASGVMADLAYGTGGMFFHNNNDLDRALRQTTETPQYIYVLGFSPQKLDGKFHKLQIKVSGGEKLTLQARAGYYALRPASTQ
jgi:VWFA-related protein